MQAEDKISKIGLKQKIFIENIIIIEGMLVCFLLTTLIVI